MELATARFSPAEEALAVEADARGFGVVCAAGALEPSAAFLRGARLCLGQRKQARVGLERRGRARREAGAAGGACSGGEQHLVRTTEGAIHKRAVWAYVNNVLAEVLLAD